jgi:hypothetical protein
MYENYLLNSTAITEILNKELDDIGIDYLTIEVVEQQLKSKKQEEIYLKKVSKADRSKPEDNLDAAKLLGDLFATLTGNRVEFSKTSHSIKLTEWLLENQPDTLEEIATMLGKVLREE